MLLHLWWGSGARTPAASQEGGLNSGKPPGHPFLDVHLVSMSRVTRLLFVVPVSFSSALTYSPLTQHMASSPLPSME